MQLADPLRHAELGGRLDRKEQPPTKSEAILQGVGAVLSRWADQHCLRELSYSVSSRNFSVAPTHARHAQLQLDPPTTDIVSRNRVFQI